MSARLAHLVLTAAALAALACHPLVRARADGGEEWELPDGGWVGAGDGCSCDDEFNDEVLEGGRRAVLRCELNLECDTRDGGCQPSVCFGPRCCIWRTP